MKQEGPCRLRLRYFFMRSSGGANTPSFHNRYLFGKERRMQKIDRVIEKYNQSVRGHPVRNIDEAERVLKAISLETSHEKLLKSL